MKLDIGIRRAMAEDADSLAALIRAAFAEYRGRLNPPAGALTETPESLRQTLARGAGFLVAGKGAPCACLFAEHRPDRLYLGRLAVDPKSRGRGLALALLAEAELYARSLGAPLLELNVRLALTGNIRLFQRAGFEIVGQRRHPGFAVPTYHVMEKRLD